jgi:hypothetical protein
MPRTPEWQNPRASRTDVEVNGLLLRLTDGAMEVFVIMRTTWRCWPMELLPFKFGSNRGVAQFVVVHKDYCSCRAFDRGDYG